MIRCIQIGRSDSCLVQGELLRDWIEPVRRPPLFELEHEHRATVDVYGREFTGVLIPSVRNGEIVQ